jgi:hypothetical protein
MRKGVKNPQINLSYMHWSSFRQACAEGHI